MYRLPAYSAHLSAAIIALAAAGYASSLHAAEFCVTCAEPAAHYNCVLPGPSGDPADARLKLLCITELAKAGKHASCSVDRQQQTPCAGPIKQIALPDGMELGPAPAPAAVTQPTAPATNELPPATSDSAAQSAEPAQTVIPKTQKPPETVKDAVAGGVASTEKALEDSGKAAAEVAKETGSTVEKAGKAVGDAAKKTWTCITSMFSDC